jgi:hypothetical protein
LEAISDAINPQGGALPSSSTLDRIIEALQPESLVNPETILYAKVWTTLRSTLRFLRVEVISGRGKPVSVCVLNDLYSGDELQEWREDATARYLLCKIPQSAIDSNTPGTSSTSFTVPTGSQMPGNKAKQAQIISGRFQKDEKYS